ncbi:MAG: sigma-70 family RNA polymerase sigma factor [Cyanobacteria bacterium SIG30]|nr:sigma-70 family RNA polymerase sigma factor [Cyanobacteria bacterium SIG30]
MSLQDSLIYPEEEQILNLINEYQTSSNKKTKQKISSFIFLTYTPVAKNIVYSFARRAYDPFEDLFQVASIGIIKALNSFDTSKGKSFKTHLSTTIVSEIRHYLRDKMSLVKVSRNVKELSFRINSIIENLTKKLGRKPTNEEISKELQVPEAKIIEAMDIERRTTPLSIEEILLENDNKDEYLKDKNSIKQYEEQISNKDYEIILKDAIHKLDSEAQDIITLSFFKDFSQAQIAKELNISPMQVSRKLKKALDELLKEVKSKGIKNYE